MELMSDEPEVRVVRWLDRLPPGRRRTALGNALTQVVEEDFADRIITFDSTAAVEYSAVLDTWMTR